MGEKEDFWKNRIYTEDVDENFDNLSGIHLKDKIKHYCLFCGDELASENMVACERCVNSYEKGKNAADSSIVELEKFISLLKKSLSSTSSYQFKGDFHGKYLFKIILAGACGKDRTALLNRYTTGQFNSDTKETTGVDFAVHYLISQDNQGTATLQIWDFGGEERFRTMLPSFCHGAAGALLFFDLVRTHTFYELDEWINIIRRNTHDIPIILVGTNYDLIKSSTDLKLNPKKVMAFIKYNKINGYVSISTKTGYNVNECFLKLAELMIK